MFPKWARNLGKAQSTCILNNPLKTGNHKELPLSELTVHQTIEAIRKLHAHK